MMGDMDAGPRVYIWGFDTHEREWFDGVLEEAGAPCGIAVEPQHAGLTVHEILFSEKTPQEPVEPDARVVLFFNCPAESIRKVMRASKSARTAPPIFAMVTQENLGWRFSELVEHLKKEHEFMQRRMKK
jgi:hypothetical protein